MTIDRGRRRPVRAALLAAAALAAAAIAGCATPPAPADGADGPTVAQYEAEKARLHARARGLIDDAEKAYDNGKVERAIELYERAVATAGDLKEGWNGLGIALMAIDDYQSAERAFMQAANADPADPRPWYNRGLLYDRRYYLIEARRFYAEALTRDRDYFPALWGVVKADVELRTEDEQTLAHIQRILFQETDPDHRSWLIEQRYRIERELLEESEARDVP